MNCTAALQYCYKSVKIQQRDLEEARYAEFRTVTIVEDLCGSSGIAGDRWIVGWQNFVFGSLKIAVDR